MKMKSKALTASLCMVALGLISASSLAEEEQNASLERRLVQDGTVHVSAFDLPLSGFLSAETRAVLKRQRRELAELAKECSLYFSGYASAEDVVITRRCLEKHSSPIIARHRARYKVAIQPETIAGVPTEIITPAEGISVTNRKRVLINLHGGSFIHGGRWGGQMTAIPIAGVGKIKVVNVDYRQAPEHRFPAASEDVAAVYKALLHDHKPEHIGIYGCSAGGILTAQSMAWFQKVGLPLPGAIGMFCAAAFWPSNDDSGQFSAAIAGGSRSIRSAKISYFRDLDFNDPLAFPGLAPEVMARFPNSLLITSTRDSAMSSVVATHSHLVKAGVEADLHVWEGLGHGFFGEPEFPESREVYDVIVRFFDEHLAGG